MSFGGLLSFNNFIIMNADIKCVLSALGTLLGIISLVAVLMTGVTTVLCYKQSYTKAQRLVQSNSKGRKYYFLVFM